MATIEYSLGTASPPLPRIGRYEPLRQLSVGPDGVAVLARDPSASKQIELRFLTRVPRGSERWQALEDRSRHVAMLEHPVCIAVDDTDFSGEIATIVLPATHGASLAAQLAHGPLPRREALRIAERLAHGLGAAHRLGFHHGSLGPSTILLSADGGAPRLDFTDTRVRPEHDDTGACAAPEAAFGSTDASSDVYSLACVVFAMLIGRIPTAAERAQPKAALDDVDARWLSSLLVAEREARPSAAEACLEIRQLLAAETAGKSRQSNAAATTLSPDTLTNLTSAGEISEGTTLGRFQLVRRLGAGGMGIVYHGVDLGSGGSVAVKVLHPQMSEDVTQLRRFKKEARMLAEIQNPYVANLIDVNFDLGSHYIVMEFVGGRCLADLPEAIRMPERDALAIAADVCRALAEPHRRGIIHRDIKPENIMFIEGGEQATTGQRIKLCDFGIAREVVSKDTVQMTAEGRLIGTPMFMAPEQCTNGVIGPATDVYSLGVTLFMMLAGRPPFDSDDLVKLMLMQAKTPAPALTEFASDVSAATAALVAKSLEKDPALRYADAAEMLEGLERILRGEPSDIAAHPKLPIVRASRVSTYVFEWQVTSVPKDLWPYLSNTDRVNRALGLPPVQFEFRDEPNGERQRIGANRVAGVALQWKEYPFEWVEAQRWGILRVFEKGVLRWYVAELELIPQERGTLVRYTMRLEPRNLLAALLVAFEIGFKFRRAFGRTLRRVDATIVEQLTRKPEVDPFLPPGSLPSASSQTVDRVFRELRSEGLDVLALEALEAFVRHAPDQEISRIRPLAFAKRFQLNPDAVVAVCLHAARRGLLVLMWDVLCPLCRVPSNFVDSLKSIADHASCPACNVEFKLDFARSIEMIFRVAPSVRPSETHTFCVGGPAHAPHVVAQVRLQPEERFSLSLTLASGEYRVRSPQLASSVTLRVGASFHPQRVDMEVGGSDTSADRCISLGPDQQLLALTNVANRELVVRVERTAARDDALTAARASSMAVFRDLFPDEVLAPGQLVAVTNVVLLITDLPDAAKLFKELGDARAFEMLLKHFHVLASVASSEGGALIKTVGNGIVASFETASSAVRAASRMHTALADEARTAPLTLRAAVHQGPAMAATINDTLDYFGQTVSAASELVSLAPPGSLLLSRAIADDTTVVALLDSMGQRPETVSVMLEDGPSWVLALTQKPSTPSAGSPR